MSQKMQQLADESVQLAKTAAMHFATACRECGNENQQAVGCFRRAAQIINQKGGKR